MNWKDCYPQIIFKLLIFIAIASYSLSCYSQLKSVSKIYDREIEFSEITWQVRNGTGNPGGNNWSDSSESVWVDENGILHLKIRKIDEVWYCSEVFSEATVGYGEYRFYIATNVENLDKNMVAGLFTYLNDKNEIDIEFSKWGNGAENKMGNYATQPAKTIGNSLSFELNLNGSYSTHRFIWKPNEIDYKSWHGHEQKATENTLIQNWIYMGTDIPVPGNEKLTINFWLFRGMSPSDEKEAEILIKSVRVYKPPVINDLQVSIPENTGFPSVIDSLITDGYSPDELDFLIVEGNNQGLFSVSEEGKIILEKELDFEESATQIIKIIAEKGDMQDTANVVINIENVNDNSPVVADAFYQVLNDIPVESIVGDLEFYDADGDALSFSFISGNEEVIYFVTQFGEIILKQPLDDNIGSSDTLTVEVSDGDFFSQAKIVIEILNNVEQSSFAAALSENVSIYPNPAGNELNISFTPFSKFKIRILSMDGKIFKIDELNSSNHSLTLDVGNLIPGNYIVLIETETGRYAFKFEKSRL